MVSLQGPHSQRDCLTLRKHLAGLIYKDGTILLSGSLGTSLWGLEMQSPSSSQRMVPSGIGTTFLIVHVHEAGRTKTDCLYRSVNRTGRHALKYWVFYLCCFLSK